MVNQHKKGFVRRSGEYLGLVSPKEPVVEQRDVGGMAAGVLPPARSDIASISVDQALSIGAVYRCVSVISSSVSQMPLSVYRAGIEIDTPTIIKQPNVNESQRQFIKKTVWSLATYGNAYWRIRTDATQQKRHEMPAKKRAGYAFTEDGTAIASLEVLDANAVTVTEERGKVRYYIGNEEITGKVKHLRLSPRPDHLKGSGPIQQGQSELIGALRVRSFADNWFGIASVPQGMLTTDQVLNAETAQEYAEAFANFVKNNGTAVLSQGMHYEHLNIKPAEAQFLEIQQAHTVAIARLFGVPATLLASGNEGTSNTYMNQQELFMQFLQTTLVDYMNEVEDALSSLLPRGQTVEFKEDTLLRMNSLLETQVAAMQIAAGVLTPDEFRAAHGLPPLPAGYEAPGSQSPNLSNGSESDGTDA